MEVERTIGPPIFRLPAEIIQDIFHIHTNVANSIRNVRLTCRYWRDLVAADHTLPRRMTLRSVDDCKGLHYPSPSQWDHCVHTAGQLIQALECIKDAQFYFHVTIFNPIDQTGWDTVAWSQFATQCTGLSILTVSDDLHEAVADILRHIPPLHNLQYLLLWRNSIVFPSSLPSALRPIPINSPNLRSMKLTWSPHREPNFQLDPFRYIFNGLTVFELFHQGRVIAANFIVALLSSLWVLKDFTWSGDVRSLDDINLIRESVDWRFKLRTLRTTAKLLSVFPPLVLSEVVVLVEDFNYLSDAGGSRRDSEAGTPRLPLPCLEDLTVSGSWSGLARIEAPNLQILHIDGDTGHFEYMDQMKLNPNYVELTDNRAGQLVETFISRGPFSKLTELCINVQYHWAHKHGRLAQVLSTHTGQTTSSQFPILRHLRVGLYERRVEYGVPIEQERCDEMVRTISTELSTLPYSVTVFWKGE